MNQINKILWGVAFIIVGLILGANGVGLTNINLFFNGWWTLFIIVPCFIGLFKKNNSKTGNIIGLLVGVLLFLSTREIIDFDSISSLIFPIILVVIGITMIFNNTTNRDILEKIKILDTDDLEPITSTFSSQKVIIDDDYKDTAIDAIFGSVEIDLTEAKIKNEQLIKSSSIFGGVKIVLPKNINVKVKSTSIFGGVENKTRNKKNNKVTIYIESFCLFGGLEIK